MIRPRALKPEDLFQIARRRREILVPFAVMTLATLVYVRYLPDRYRSETVIMVVPQRVPEDYVRSTVTTKIENRLQSINQLIMSRTRLEPIIREFNLYPDLVKLGMMEDVIDHMRRDTTAQQVRGDAFRVAYEAGDPHTAMRVTERIASLYIDENLRDREVLADGTQQFLETQLDAAKSRLIEHEKKLEAYNRRYSGQLPTQVTSNLQVLQTTQLQMQALVDSIARDKDRRSALDAMLGDAESSQGTASAFGPADPAPPPSLAALEQAQKDLQELEQRYTPEHPDVGRQRRLVADLKRRVNEEMSVAAGAPRQPKTGPDRLETARLNRVVQAQAELDGLNKEIARKEREEQRLRDTIAEYQSRVEGVPARESELIELTRDYNTLQTSYTSLLKKKEDAQIAANLERYQIGEQFKVLDPARLPEKPFSPDRPFLYAVGALTGLGLGIALATLLELLDSSFRTDAAVVVALGLPVLALIPELVTDSEKAAIRRRRLIVSSATAGAAMVLASALFWVLGR